MLIQHISKAFATQPRQTQYIGSVAESDLHGQGGLTSYITQETWFDLPISFTSFGTVVAVRHSNYNSGPTYVRNTQCQTTRFVISPSDNKTERYGWIAAGC